MKLKTFRNKFSPSTPIFCDMDPKHEGWNSHSPVFAETINKVKPDSIVEVGSWLGKSAIHMAELMENPNVLCVDVFLGTHELTWNKGKIIDVSSDFDRIYKQFCTNITDANLNDGISPLPMSSSAAAELLTQHKVTADIVYIDAGHLFRDVIADLEDWWPIAEKVVIGDDYHTDWPGVIKAANLFQKSMNIKMEVKDRKFIMWK